MGSMRPHYLRAKNGVVPRICIEIYLHPDILLSPDGTVGIQRRNGMTTNDTAYIAFLAISI